jgi:UDP-glucose 4-epimerase
LHYYDVNVGGTIALAEVMEEFDCHRLVFSSSATVYGAEAPIPYVETLPPSACNVYGRTKLIVEEILQDSCHKANSQWQVSLLRYFNPIGAHASGLIGEDPQGIPNNLLPFVAQVAVGRLKELQIFGDDYPTIDGTGIRDYIHVVDLARGHVKALQKMLKSDKGCCTYNLGAGKGSSVLEVIAEFEKASGKKIPYKIAPRREGDLAEYYADATLALKELGWKTELELDAMVADTWRWQSQNPNGYAG